MRNAALLTLLLASPAGAEPFLGAPTFAAPASPGLSMPAARFYAAADAAPQRFSRNDPALAKVRALRQSTSEKDAAGHEDQLYGLFIPGFETMPTVARDAMLDLERKRAGLLVRIQMSTKRLDAKRQRKLESLKTDVLKAVRHEDLDAASAQLDGLFGGSAPLMDTAARKADPVPAPPPALAKTLPSKTAEALDAAYDGGSRGFLDDRPSGGATIAMSDSYLAALRFIDDAQKAKPESVSVGLPQKGKLVNPAELPVKGYGYEVARPGRKRNFGSDELVYGLIEVAADLNLDGSQAGPLLIGDICSQKGGPQSDHVSHENGRDADIGFFWTDAKGTPIAADGFVAFNSKGTARHEGRTIKFDLARNWALVRKLLTNRHFGDKVEYIFVYAPLKALLLDYAKKNGEDGDIVKRARSVLGQPGDSGPHDDHFHVRILPSDHDQPWRKSYLANNK